MLIVWMFIAKGILKCFDPSSGMLRCVENLALRETACMNVSAHDSFNGWIVGKIIGCLRIRKSMLFEQNIPQEPHGTPIQKQKMLISLAFWTSDLSGVLSLAKSNEIAPRMGHLEERNSSSRLCCWLAWGSYKQVVSLWKGDGRVFFVIFVCGFGFLWRNCMSFVFVVVVHDLVVCLDFHGLGLLWNFIGFGSLLGFQRLGFSRVIWWRAWRFALLKKMIS